MHNLANIKGHMIQSPRHTTDLYTHIHLYNNCYTIITYIYHINGLYFLYKDSICSYSDPLPRFSEILYPPLAHRIELYWSGPPSWCTTQYLFRVRSWRV